MALPASGAITLNEIHVEAGGSSGSECSINDSDIRLIANKSSGATASWNDYYSRAADFTTVVTVGGINTSSSDGYTTTFVRYRGFLNSSPSGASNIGSLSVSNDADYFSNNGFTDLMISGTQGQTNSTYIRVRASAQNIANNDTAFKSVVIGSATYNRTDATYETSNGRSQWYWADTSVTVPSDDTSAFAPFAATGSTTTVVFRRSR